MARINNENAGNGVKRPHARMIFITGTDTGVGKTVLTAMLLAHARAEGVDALAMKPFCSGGRGDVELVQEIQEHRLPDDWINPYYFPAPMAPAANNEGKRVRLAEVVSRIKRVERECELLIVEGIGGLMVPLSPKLLVLDVIAKLGCPVVLVSQNRLGTINHTLLSVRALREAGIQSLSVALMTAGETDVSSKSNGEVLCHWLKKHKTPIFEIGNLGQNASDFEAVKKNAHKMKKDLAPLLGFK